MDRWRGLAEPNKPNLNPAVFRPQLEADPQHSRQEGQGGGVRTVGPTPIIVKKENISDVPCKVPKFQYVDFPSLHQCIQQLAIPPLESWLAGCPAAWPPGRSSRDTTERVPKFKYVDYPSLHHCIQQLSVPPLESWSSRLPRSGASGGLGSGTGAPATPGDANEERGGQATGRKRARDAVVPGPSPSPGPSPVREKAVSAARSRKPQLSAHAVDQSEARQPVGSGRVQHYAEITKGSEVQRPSLLAHDRAAAQSKASKGRQPTDNRVYLDLESDQIQLRGRPEPRDSDAPEESFWRTVTESVCPFCQKMFTDPEELRVHQKSHRDKVCPCPYGNILVISGCFVTLLPSSPIFFL